MDIKKHMEMVVSRLNANVWNYTNCAYLKWLEKHLEELALCLLNHACSSDFNDCVSAIVSCVMAIDDKLRADPDMKSSLRERDMVERFTKEIEERVSNGACVVSARTNNDLFNMVVAGISDLKLALINYEVDEACWNASHIAMLALTIAENVEKRRRVEQKEA